jgi:hypothetical protein
MMFDDIRLMVDDARLIANHILPLYDPLSRILFERRNVLLA